MLEYKFQDQENSEDIFSFGSALEDFILLSPDTAYPPVGYNVSNLLLRQRIDLFSLNNVSVLPNNTTYSVTSIRHIILQQIYTAYSNQLNMTKAKTGTMVKPSFENNIQSNNDSDNVTHELNKKTTIEIRDEFMKILQDNAFNGIDRGDVINHTVKIMEILEYVKIPNVDKNQLRLHVFLISLSGHAKVWWDNEIKVTIKYDFNNPNEVCKSEEFKVIRYSIGTDEEFITISPSKYDTWGKTYGSMMQYGVSLGLGYDVLTTCTDLAVKKLTIWYTLKKTCVEFVRAF
ncbi:hypothetical protein Tco_0630489 [Tanacetum coccineum]